MFSFILMFSFSFLYLVMRRVKPKLNDVNWALRNSTYSLGEKEGKGN